MPKSTIDWFELSRELLALVMQNRGDKIFIVLEKICAIAHGNQAFPLLEKHLNV